MFTHKKHGKDHMFEHKETKILPYTKEQIFHIVLDVARYPEFLPWTSHARVYDVTDKNMLADLGIGYKWISDSYTSLITFERFNWIRVEHIKGPFNHLLTTWAFDESKDMPKSTRVSFNIVFDLTSGLFQSMLESYFSHACEKILTAFEERAKELYGT
ncbi:MAG: type II toxin-antitoxin system RatA family toxin [Alphaproteobacteria bacterium]|nr:type II toxin-antitoxin system RatA family toxin [Alphaproteobacteria bacterium]MBX9976695.1 type II toxin-antitoxin system RatA family toxin [Alphaproteobacteria bacterium]